jgi:hypothetical protein
MAGKGDWTAPWAAKKLRGDSRVSGVTVAAPGRLEIQRHDLPPITVVTLAVALLDQTILSEALRSDPQPDFVLNLQSNASLTTEALHLSAEEQVPVGRMGDLERALSMAQVREYVDPETLFRERGMEQHARVAGFQRLDLNRYRIERRGLSPLTVIFLNDYELSAEAIRQARAGFGDFDIVVASNPNGRITDSAAEVAKQLGSEVHRWGAFMSRLHRERDQR